MIAAWLIWGTALLALTALSGAGGGRSHVSELSLVVTIKTMPNRIEPNPLQAVRMLTALQERIADGETGALASMADVSREIGRRLTAFDMSVWGDARHREALLKYVLSGGEPGLVEELLARKKFTKAEQQLAQGAIAYAHGENVKAAAALTGIEVRELPPSLGGHVALLTAVLLAEQDPMRALKFCDEARLLSPGTLVEEAALRLTIELTIATSDMTSFRVAVLRHLRRFPRSLYSRVADLRIARVLAAQKYKASEDARVLSAMGNSNVPIERRQFLLGELADAALRVANVEMAGIAAGHLHAVVAAASPAAAKSRAIEAAGAILAGKSDQAKSLVEEAMAAKPASEVRALLGQLQALSEIINAPPQKTDWQDRGWRNLRKPMAPTATVKKRSVQDAAIVVKIDAMIANAEAKFLAVEKLLSENGS